LLQPVPIEYSTLGYVPEPVPIEYSSQHFFSHVSRPPADPFVSAVDDVLDIPNLEGKTLYDVLQNHPGFVSTSKLALPRDADLCRFSKFLKLVDFVEDISSILKDPSSE
jgi:hypothetical protein